MSRTYHELPRDEETSSENSFDALLEKDITFRRCNDTDVGASSFLRRYRSWLAHAALLSLSMAFFVASLCQRWSRISDLQVTEKYSSWSPVAHIVKYDTVRYNLTPLVEGPFVGYGPKVDKAWDGIANDMGDTMISEEELDRLGLPRNSLKITHPETGEQGYRAAVEVFHQLHCLNLLRQRIYSDYYKNIWSDIQEEEHGLKGHVDHCLETLRINLMCTSDIGIFTFREYPEYGFEKEDFWPDFSTLHTCRNFDAIHQWGIDHTVSWTHDV